VDHRNSHRLLVFGHVAPQAARIRARAIRRAGELLKQFNIQGARTELYAFEGLVAPAGGRGAVSGPSACLPTYLALLGHLAAGFADLVVLLRDWRARSALESNVLPQDGQALGSFKKS